MELKPFLLFLFTFYLISCANSAFIYNDELFEDEYASRILPRLSRSPHPWNQGDEKKPSQQMRNILAEQDGLRHENAIYITLAGNSERSKELSEDKHESTSLWSILGKTTEFLAPSFVKGLLPRSFTDDFIIRSRSKFDPPPFNPNAVVSRSRFDSPRFNPIVLEPRSRFDSPRFNPIVLEPRSRFDSPRFNPIVLEPRSKFDPPPFNPDNVGSRSNFDPPPFNPNAAGARWFEY